MLHQTTLAVLALAASACHRNLSHPTPGAGPLPRPVDAAHIGSELQANRGHPTFVNFWATWCEPCMEELPDIARAAQIWRPRGVRFVSISADDVKDLALVQRTLDRFGAEFDTVLVTAGDTDALIREVDTDWTGTLPASFFYNASGERTRKVLGRISAKVLDSWLSEGNRPSPPR